MNSLSINNVWHLYEDSARTIWVGTIGGGVNRFYPEVGIFKRYQADPNLPNTLIDNTVWDIREDEAGRMWFATNNGVDRFQLDSERFIHYGYNERNPDDPESLSSPIVYVVYIDRSGQFWIGTDGGGVDTFSNSNNSFLDIFNLLENNSSIIFTTEGFPISFSFQ